MNEEQTFDMPDEDRTFDVPDTDNEEWGFYGTWKRAFLGAMEEEVRRDGSLIVGYYPPNVAWRKVSLLLRALFDGPGGPPTPERIRTMLDSTVGRHFADALDGAVYDGTAFEVAVIEQFPRFNRAFANV